MPSPVSLMVTVPERSNVPWPALLSVASKDVKVPAHLPSLVLLSTARLVLDVLLLVMTLLPWPWPQPLSKAPPSAPRLSASVKPLPACSMLTAAVRLNVLWPASLLTALMLVPEPVPPLPPPASFLALSATAAFPPRPPRPHSGDSPSSK